jgi:hypothetical protein
MVDAVESGELQGHCVQTLRWTLSFFVMLWVVMELLNFV